MVKKLAIVLPAAAFLVASMPTDANARTKDVVKYGAIGLGAAALYSLGQQSAYSQPSYYGGYYSNGYSYPSSYSYGYSSYPAYSYSYPTTTYSYSYSTAPSYYGGYYYDYYHRPVHRRYRHHR